MDRTHVINNANYRFQFEGIEPVQLAGTLLWTRAIISVTSSTCAVLLQQIIMCCCGKESDSLQTL